MFRITSFGAAQEVTGSSHLLEVGQRKILLDCGMHQGGDAVRRLRQERFGFRPRQLSAMVLSHAHLDHSGLLPKLVRAGYQGPIYCTPATRNLLAIMLEDAASIYLRDLEGANLRLKRSGRREIPPEYGMEDVLRVLELCQPVEYHQLREILPEVSLQFLDAGHILGSSVVEVTCRDGGETRTLVFSGDLGNDTGVLMRNPEVPPRADLVLMESTYGNRDHRPLGDTLAEMEAVLREAEHSGGVVLMPAFAVGRTQELLFHLGCLYHQGRMPGWRVFLDSPMAIEVTRLYDQWLDILEEADQRRMRHFGAGSLEAFLPVLQLTPTVGDSMMLNRIEGRAIIIAGSGMCNGGRIRHHLKHRLWQARNHIVFAGFQARGTLGRQLVDREPYVKLFGQRFAVHAQIHTLGGFSAHAGRSQLLEWAEGIGGSPHFRLIHGEPEALQSLAHELARRGRAVSIAEPQAVHEF